MPKDDGDAPYGASQDGEEIKDIGLQTLEDE
jgi:hypothetical protein